MYTLMRQIFIAVLGGVVAAGVILVANGTERQAGIALAQVNVGSPGAVDAGAPHYINYQGQVYNPNSGVPIANTGLNFSFRLYNNSSATNQVYREDKFITTNVDGFFNTNIGDTNSFGDLTAIFNGQELYLRIYINGQELGPMQTITYVPYAIWTRTADRLGPYGSSDFPKLIAFGVVNDDGGRASGENFSSDRENVGGQDVYVINLEGANHSIHEYTTIVTPACARPVITGVGTSDDDLVVDIWDHNGDRTQCRFEFMVLSRD